MAKPKLTRSVRLILQALLDANDDHPMYGFQLLKQTGLESGTLYPALLRLHKEGVVAGEREEGEPAVLGRPLRTYYRLTGEGELWARRALVPDSAARKPRLRVIGATL